MHDSPNKGTICVSIVFSKQQKTNSEGCDSGKDTIPFVTTFLQGQFLSLVEFIGEEVLIASADVLNL